MKKISYLLPIVLLFMLSACGGSATTENTDTGVSAVSTETPLNGSEANNNSATGNESGQTSNTPSEQNNNASNTGSGNCYNEYYPVKSGVSWAYTMNSSLTGEDSFTRSILDVNDTGFTDQDTWAIGTVRTGSWTCDNGNLTALSLGGLATVSASEQTFVATSQESSGVTYPSPMDVGTSWSQHLTISGDMVVTEGMSGTTTAEATQSCTAVGEESVSVPAGTFDAMKLNCTTAITVTLDIEGMAMEPTTINATSDMWFVKGVGMVKTVDNNDLTSATIELTSYVIP